MMGIKQRAAEFSLGVEGEVLQREGSFFCPCVPVFEEEEAMGGEERRGVEEEEHLPFLARVGVRGIDVDDIEYLFSFFEFF